MKLDNCFYMVICLSISYIQSPQSLMNLQEKLWDYIILQETVFLASCFHVQGVHPHCRSVPPPITLSVSLLRVSSYWVDENDFKFTILLPQALGSWNYRSAPSCLALWSAS